MAANNDFQGNLAMADLAELDVVDNVVTTELNNASLAPKSQVTSKPQAVPAAPIEAPRQDKSRNDLLTDFGKRTLLDRYLLPGETQSMTALIASSMHGQKMSG